MDIEVVEALVKLDGAILGDDVSVNNESWLEESINTVVNVLEDGVSELGWIVRDILGWKWNIEVVVLHDVEQAGDVVSESMDETREGLAEVKIVHEGSGEVHVWNVDAAPLVVLHGELVAWSELWLDVLIEHGGIEVETCAEDHIIEFEPDVLTVLSIELNFDEIFVTVFPDLDDFDLHNNILGFELISLSEPEVDTPDITNVMGVLSLSEPSPALHHDDTGMVLKGVCGLEG